MFCNIIEQLNFYLPITVTDNQFFQKQTIATETLIKAIKYIMTAR